MADRFVTVDETYRFPTPLEARLAGEFAGLVGGKVPVAQVPLDFLNGMYARGGNGKGVHLVGGTLRNVQEPEFWQPVADATHTNFGINGVTTTETSIIVDIASEATKIGTVLVVPDETMAADGYFVGGSGGGSAIHIQIGRRKSISDRIWYDTATSTWKTEGSVFQVESFTGGLLTLVHDDMTGPNGVNAIMHSDGANFATVSVASAINVNKTVLRFHNAAGEIFFSPNAGMRVFVTRNDNRELGAVDPRYFINTAKKPFHNLWLLAVQPY